MDEGEARTIDAVVGANIRGRRAGLGLPQPDLAAVMTTLGEAAWSASTVSRVESGKRSISTRELLSLAVALGATLEDLLDPLAFGDESDVVMPGGRIDAWRLRAVVRGDVRIRVSLEGPDDARRVRWKVGKTERGGETGVLAFGLPGGERVLREIGEQE